MRNIWHLFRNDVRRLTTNVVTGIIVLGLVLIPSIFSWYNIIACWDVFDNTGNLTVAVANTDEGYQSDLVPLKVNVGEQVVSALRANDQLNWTFVSEEEAVDGARSGKYYAAVVIPPSFSKDMMTFYSDDVEHAHIVYYTNEKKSAVAPKVTDQGADQVSYEVNKVFAETLSEVALAVSSSLSDYADSSDADGRIGDVAAHVNAMGAQMAQAAAVLTTYSSIMESSQALINGSSALLSQAKSAAGQVGETAAAPSRPSLPSPTRLRPRRTIWRTRCRAAATGTPAWPTPSTRRSARPTRSRSIPPRGCAARRAPSTGRFPSTRPSRRSSRS